VFFFFKKVSNFLSPGNRVISGSDSLCSEAITLSPKYGAKTTRKLAVAGAFHSHYMESASAPMREALQNTKFVRPRIPVLSNVDCLPHHEPAEIRDVLVKQLTSPVKWEQTMEKLLNEGYERFFEVGTGNVLVGLMRHIIRKTGQKVSDLQSYSI
jgi:[acyl-carrier-protein] S-malonyltransferase